MMLSKLLGKKITDRTVPAVSIVMPSFNQARFIGPAISSILQQASLDLEVIVADGGSTDETLQILARLSSESDGKVKWISEADRGAAHAINKAIDRASAPIIGWLNSDDLYASDAIQSAYDYFSDNSNTLMVYGRGMHINDCGQELDEYRTLPPDTSIGSFRDGCFICQPTVFMRRELLDEVGQLDETLKTAFDFDLWLRVFSQYQDRVGYLDKVLAFSRLHSDCITLSMRQTVALEGMQVIARYLGSAPHNWIVTYINELFAQHPYVSSAADIPVHIRSTVERSKSYLDDHEAELLDKQVTSDIRIKLAGRGIYINALHDGWLSPESLLRIVAKDKIPSEITLVCRHTPLGPGDMQVKVYTPWGSVVHQTLKKKGKFTIDIKLPVKYDSSGFLLFPIVADQFYIPCELVDSDDARMLAFRLDDIEVY